MKRFPGLLASLSLNALLILTMGWIWRPQTVVASKSAPATGTASKSKPSPQRPANATPTDPTLVDFAIGSVDWARFSTGDWRRYRDELIASGCPRRTVREIIEPLVDRHFIARSQPLTAEYSARFWELACPPTKSRMELWEQKFKQLDAERESVLTQLFPTGWTAEPPRPQSGQDERLGFLPRDRVDRVLAAERNRDELMAEARNVQPDPQLQAELIRRAGAAFDAELAGLLSAEELNEFRARSSGSSWWVRQLGGVALSPEELAAITRIQDREHPGKSAQSPEVAEARKAEIKVLLGEERFEQFERAQDGTFQQLLTMAARTGLETVAVNELWQTQRSYHEQAEALSRDPTLDRAERSAQLTALQQQHEQVVREFLTPTPGAFEAWQRQQAHWLKDTFSLPRENPVGDWLKEP